METLSLNLVSVELNRKTVVDRVSAMLSPGKIHVLVGPNGAGKSTLLRAMAALVPLSLGTIALNGEELARMAPAKRADYIAYLPQDRTIAWDLPAVDIAALGAYHLAPELARQKAFEALSFLGLQEAAEQGVFSLSGGQRARVLLARVLVGPAKCLVLDEPLTALDPAWQRQVLMELRRFADMGGNVILSLHDLSLAAQFADDILVMHQGCLVAAGPPETVFTVNVLRDVFNLEGKLETRSGQSHLSLAMQPTF